MNAKYAYIDRSGRIVLDAGRYNRAGNFSEGLAPVGASGTGWGFIDKTGAVVIPPEFGSALSFRGGLAAVLLDGKWGFIDKKGVLVIENQFEWVAEFSEGVAVVQRSLKSPQPKEPASTKSNVMLDSFIVEVWDLTSDYDQSADDESEYLLIDTTGEILAVLDRQKVEVNIDDAKFAEGLLCAYSPETDAMGYINKAVEFVIEPKFTEAGSFSEGLGRVAVLENGMEKLAFIDKKADFVVPPTFNTDFDFRRNSTDFSEGLASVSEGLNPSRMKESTFVYIDKAGEIVIATEFFYAGEFRDGLAIVYDSKTNQWGFIDKNGKVAIPVQYSSVNNFSDGLALVDLSPALEIHFM